MQLREVEVGVGKENLPSIRSEDPRGISEERPHPLPLNPGSLAVNCCTVAGLKPPRGDLVDTGRRDFWPLVCLNPSVLGLPVVGRPLLGLLAISAFLTELPSCQGACVMLQNGGCCDPEGTGSPT